MKSFDRWAMFAVLVAGTTNMAWAQADHLIVTAQDASVGKQITVHEPNGTEAYTYTPTGSATENTPNFIESIPSQQRFLVTCTDGGASTGGSIEVFDYSAYATGGAIAHVTTIEPGDKPFHTSVTPDNRVCVAMDGETPGRLLLIDLDDPENYTSLIAGQNHATTAFVPIGGGEFDIYASNFFGPGTNGSMDILEFSGDSWSIRADDVPLNNPLPHTAVYSPYDQRVYFTTAGELAGFDTQGANKDTLTRTLPTVAGQMTPLLSASSDGRYLYGNLHYDGAPGSYFYKVDLSDDSVTSATSVSCKYYAFSPDGEWIVAGDFNRDPGQTNNKVQVLALDSMTVTQEWELTGADASQVGFQAAAFSPNGRYAYLGLTQADKVLVVDTEDLSNYSTFSTTPAPKWLRTLDVQASPSSVSHWEWYQ